MLCWRKHNIGHVQKQSSGGALQKNVFLEISQNSRENSWARVSFFNKVADFNLQLYYKRDPGTGGFPVNFAKISRTPFLTEHLRWLLLHDALHLLTIRLRDEVRSSKMQ